MRMRSFLSLALLSLIACGGGSKSSDTTPGGEDLEATPVAPADEAAPTDPVAEAPAPAGDNTGTCATLCDRLLGCAMELSKQQPTDEQLAEAKTQCNTECVKETSDKLEAANKCVTDNPDSCPGLFECLEPLQSEG